MGGETDAIRSIKSDLSAASLHSFTDPALVLSTNLQISAETERLSSLTSLQLCIFNQRTDVLRMGVGVGGGCVINVIACDWPTPQVHAPSDRQQRMRQEFTLLVLIDFLFRKTRWREKSERNNSMSESAVTCLCFRCAVGVDVISLRAVCFLESPLFNHSVLPCNYTSLDL